MTREIKFKRVFFFDEKKTKFSHFTEWGVNLRASSFTSPSTNNFAYYYTDCQYTGIKDKNGVEIYDGDICEFYIIADDSGMATDLFGAESHLNSWVNCVYLEKITAIVEFKNGQFVFAKNKTRTFPIDFELFVGNIIDEKYQLINKDERTVIEDDLYKPEVIGNIHQNPELI